MDVHPSARHLARGKRPMDGLVLTLFVVAAFAGGFVSGFSGFAMGLVVSGVWLHIITPIQRGPDRRLRSAHAGLRHPETASGVRLAKNLAAFAWHDDRDSDRSDPAEPSQPDLPAVRRRCF